MIPMILWSGAIPKTQSRYIFLIAWIGVFLVTMGLYFHDLKNETDPQFSYKQGEEQTMERNFSSFFKNRARGWSLSYGSSGAIWGEAGAFL